MRRKDARGAQLGLGDKLEGVMVCSTLARPDTDLCGLCAGRAFRGIMDGGQSLVGRASLGFALHRLEHTRFRPAA
jgi:hypothetical protein